MTPASHVAFDEYNRRAELVGWPSRVDPTLAFECSELHDGLAVWRRAAKSRPFPQRTDLTPRLMKRFLPQVAIVDVVRDAARTRFRIRVSGTALEQTFGGLSGRFLDESLPGPVLTRWEATLGVPLCARCAARSFGRIEFRDQTHLKIETFYGPMGSDVTAPDSMLLVVHVEPNVAQNLPAIEKLSCEANVRV